MSQLLVFFIVIKRNDRNSVLDLISKRIRRIIHKHNIAELSIRQDPKIFYIDPFRSLNAALSEQPVMDVLLSWVKVIEHDVRIAAMRSRENDDFEILTKLLEAFDSIWSDIDSRLWLYMINKRNQADYTSIIWPCGNFIGSLTS